jgi:hypothetical protein
MPLIGIMPPANGGDLILEPVEITPSFMGSTRKHAIAGFTAQLNNGFATALPEVPAQAQSAIMVLEAAAGSDKSAALGRFWMDGTTPNANEGLPIYHGAVIEIIGINDLNRTLLFSTDGAHHKINVQYFNAE